MWYASWRQDFRIGFFFSFHYSICTRQSERPSKPKFCAALFWSGIFESLLYSNTKFDPGLLTTLYQQSNLCIPGKGIARPQSQFLHSCACEQGLVQIFGCSKINLSQMYECRNWETEHYNSFLEITRKRNCAASVSITTFMCLCTIYIFPGSVYIFGCSK